MMVLCATGTKLAAALARFRTASKESTMKGFVMQEFKRIEPSRRIAREKIVRRACAPRSIAGMTALWSARGMHDIADTQASEPESLLEPAAAWVDLLRKRGQTYLFYPLSRLQRRFRLGQGRIRALADLLEQRGEWSIAIASDGTRYARIRARVGA
jgi:hypothetical protein